MRYHVRGRFLDDRREEFFRALTDGTVASQQPDGPEILASMRRAVRRDDRVEWTETCYCATPLAHERETVLDRFFSEIETEPIDADPALEGESFWAYLEGGREAEGAGGNSGPGAKG
ncbi:MAG: hypothetical protein ACE5IM_14570, partial [Nitrospinota bacterium]